MKRLRVRRWQVVVYMRTRHGLIGGGTSRRFVRRRNAVRAAARLTAMACPEGFAQVRRR